MNSDRIYSVVTPMLRGLVKGRMGADRRRHFEAVPVPKGRVLFLGDSITEGGLWGDLFPELPTTNRGIGGEATYDLLERVDAAINDPLAVSLMIGTNDLHGPRALRETGQIVERAGEIVRRIRAGAPQALILVNSVLPAPRSSLRRSARSTWATARSRTGTTRRTSTSGPCSPTSPASSKQGLARGQPPPRAGRLPGLGRDPPLLPHQRSAQVM